MTVPVVIKTVLPKLEVLGNALNIASQRYQQVLTPTSSLDLCAEAGRTLRHLSEDYSRVLLAALAYDPDYDEESVSVEDIDDANDWQADLE